MPGCLWEKTRQRKGVKIRKGTAEICLLNFRLEMLENAKATTVSSESLSFRSMLSLVTDGGSWSSFYWLLDHSICFVQVDTYVNKFFFWDKVRLEVPTSLSSWYLHFQETEGVCVCVCVCVCIIIVITQGQSRKTVINLTLLLGSLSLTIQGWDGVKNSRKLSKPET